MSKYRIVERRINQRILYVVEKRRWFIWVKKFDTDSFEESKWWILNDKDDDERDGTVVHEE